ncbi:MAG: HEPN domain-containing protein [Myxococcota bacterium]
MWWLPAQPRETVHGELRFEPFTGAHLTTFGPFASLQGETASRQEIVLGVGSQGRLITLCHVSGAPSPRKVMQEVESVAWSPLPWSFRAELVVLGQHITDPRQLQFDTVRVHYSHLATWANTAGFRMHSRNSKTQERRAYHISHALPRPISCKMADCNVTMGFSVTSTHSNSEIRLKQTPFVEITHTRPRDWQDCQHALMLLQNFLSFGANAPVQPCGVHARMPGCNQPCRLLHRLRGFPQPAKPLRQTPQPLFTLKDIAKKLDTYLRNWFAKAHVLQPIHLLYFAIVFGPSLYAQNKFLHLIQAIETYHSRTRKGQASLRKRLLEVLDELRDVFILKQQLRKDFVTRVVRTRNYLTHYGKADEKKRADLKEMHLLASEMNTMVKAVLLLQAGFSRTKVKALLAQGS